MKTITLLFFSATIILNSCNASKKAINDMSTIKDNYNVITLGNKNVTSEKLSIQFSDKEKRVSGFSGCNRFFGSYTFNNDAITFKGMASTKKLCLENQNAIENKMLNSLKHVNRYKIIDDKIVLLQDDKELLVAKEDGK